MDNEQAHAFLTRYFGRLFENHDLQALDEYLHPDYHDDDIGDDAVDHIENAKVYLADALPRTPISGSTFAPRSRSTSS